MKKAMFIITTLLLVSSLMAYNWPQNEITADSFNSFFGQYRGGKLSTSLVFSDTEFVQASETGRVLAVLGDTNDSDFFPSTLGNAIIIAHKDDILTVYGNLDEDFQEFRNALKVVEAGTNLGVCSNTGWLENENCLEFQMIDTREKRYFNPINKNLLPRIGQESELTVKNVIAINSKGKEFNLHTEDVIQAGPYKLYKNRQEKEMPYKSSIFINGVSVESITYDYLSKIDRQIQVRTAKDKYYTSDQIYPDSKRQFLGEINIPKGNITLEVIVADVQEKEKRMTYSFTAK